MLVCIGVPAPLPVVVALAALVALSFFDVIREELKEDLRFELASRRSLEVGIHETEVLEQAQGREGFSCASFEFPHLVCPRDEFEEILARHEGLIRARLQAILFMVRREERRYFPKFDNIHFAAAEIDAHRTLPVPRVLVRNRVVVGNRFSDFSSIAWRLGRHPGRLRMPVVVLDENVVSLHFAELRSEKLPNGTVHRELVLAPDSAIFEPVRQEANHDGSSWIRYWRATASSPPHKERIVLRPPAATRDEYLDRLFAVCEEQLRKYIASRETGGSVGQLLMCVSPSEKAGPCVVSMANKRADWLEFVDCYPGIHLALQRPWPKGWVPVLVQREVSFAGLRWIATRPDVDARTAPAPVPGEWRAGRTRRVASR
jgi:hypothetical protein